jgi:hypothetical protein
MLENITRSSRTKIGAGYSATMMSAFGSGASVPAAIQVPMKNRNVSLPMTVFTSIGLLLARKIRDF